MPVVTIGGTFTNLVGRILNLAKRDPVAAYHKAISLARWIQRIPLTNDQTANDQRALMAHTMAKVIQQIRMLIYQQGQVSARTA